MDLGSHNGESVCGFENYLLHEFTACDIHANAIRMRESTRDPLHHHQADAAHGYLMRLHPVVGLKARILRRDQPQITLSVTFSFVAT